MSEDQIRRDQEHPLYEWSQVITHEELHALLEEMYRAYQDTPWYKPIEKLKIVGGFYTARAVLEWLHEGKPYDVSFIKNQSGTGANHEKLN